MIRGAKQEAFWKNLCTALAISVCQSDLDKLDQLPGIELDNDVAAHQGPPNLVIAAEQQLVHQRDGDPNGGAIHGKDGAIVTPLAFCLPQVSAVTLCWCISGSAGLCGTFTPSGGVTVRKGLALCQQLSRQRCHRAADGIQQDADEAAGDEPAHAISIGPLVEQAAPHTNLIAPAAAGVGEQPGAVEGLQLIPAPDVGALTGAWLAHCSHLTLYALCKFVRWLHAELSGQLRSCLSFKFVHGRELYPSALLSAVCGKSGAAVRLRQACSVRQCVQMPMPLLMALLRKKARALVPKQTWSLQLKASTTWVCHCCWFCCCCCQRCRPCPRIRLLSMQL